MNKFKNVYVNLNNNNHNNHKNLNNQNVYNIILNIDTPPP